MMEEGLRHGGLAAVVGEVSRVAMPSTRRLQLAAEESGTMALMLKRRQFRNGDGLDDIMHADRLRELLQGLLVKIMPGLSGVGLDLIESDPQHIGDRFHDGGLQITGSGLQIGVDTL